MNGSEWLTHIRKRRPQYALNRSKLIERFANKGASKSDFVQFGPIYQLYMYAFMLGFHKRLRIPLPSSPSERKDFLEIGKWQPEGLVNYILMLLLSQSTIREELGLNFKLMESLQNDEVKEKFNSLIKVMEEFANGGFSLLQEKFDLDPYFFNNSFAFPAFLKEISDGKVII